MASSFVATGKSYDCQTLHQNSSTYHLYSVTAISIGRLIANIRTPLGALFADITCRYHFSIILVFFFDLHSYSKQKKNQDACASR